MSLTSNFVGIATFENVQLEIDCAINSRKNLQQQYTPKIQNFHETSNRFSKNIKNRRSDVPGTAPNINRQFVEKLKISTSIVLTLVNAPDRVDQHEI